MRALSVPVRSRSGGADLLAPGEEERPGVWGGAGSAAVADLLLPDQRGGLPGPGGPDGGHRLPGVPQRAPGSAEVLRGTPLQVSLWSLFQACSLSVSEGLQAWDASLTSVLST